MTVEFRVLGEVEALLDGRQVDVGHARQRCALAALLVEVNRPVTADALIDRVWAERPPYRARNALSAYLSRLRQRLAAAPGVRLGRAPGGYQLTADPQSVDLHLFRRLAAEARAADRPADAAARYDRALALWRGEPFATIDTPWFDTVRTSLQAERLAVELDHNDAALHAGRHGELLVGLSATVRDHPLDERLAGQLMLALYRSGRQADALDTYQRVRGTLLEELGADPGAALRQMHQQILIGDAAGGAAAASPPEPARVEPSTNLPRRATSFVGRHGDVDRVAAAVVEDPLVTLTGVGGVGKSRLAVEAAGGVRARFTDGVWLCELAPLDDGAAVAHAVAATLGVQQRHGLTIEQTVVEYLRGRELLLVLDNCEHVLDAAAQLIDQVVRQCPTVAVLATSREPLGVEGERILPVDPLPVPEATALFTDRARANRPEFSPEGDAGAAVAEICRRLDGLPLAVELAAARTRVMNVVEVARRLDGGRFVSGGSRGTLPRHQSLVAAIDWSYRPLSDPERALFARLSVFAGGFDLGGAYGVCGDQAGTEDDTLELLSGLVDKSMVTVLGGAAGTRYRLLETLRAFGRQRLREAAEDDRCGRRHAEYFARLAEQAAAGLHGPDERAWVERVVPDYDNLRSAFERAVADRDGDLAARLVTSVSELAFLRVGYEMAGWAERALDLIDRSHPLVPAAAGLAARGAFSRGDYTAARELAARAGGRVPGRGTGRIGYPADVLADVALYEGDADVALRYWDSEVLRARREADPIRLVWSLYYVAVCQAVLRAPERGLPSAQESVQVADTTGNPTALSMSRYALGLVLKKSDPQRALALFDRAAELAASVHNFWWRGVALMEAAATRAVHAEPAAGARALVEVLDHWERVGDWTQQWLNLRYVVRLLFRLGADEDAVALHHAMVAAGRPSPLDTARLAALADALGAERFDAAAQRGTGLSGAAVVGQARASLRRFA